MTFLIPFFCTSGFCQYFCQLPKTEFIFFVSRIIHISTVSDKYKSFLSEYLHHSRVDLLAAFFFTYSVLGSLLLSYVLLYLNLAHS